MVEGFVVEGEMTVMPPNQVDEILVGGGGGDATVPLLEGANLDNAVMYSDLDIPDDMPALEPLLNVSPGNDNPSAPAEKSIPDAGKTNVIPLGFHENATADGEKEGKMEEVEAEGEMSEEYIAESLKMIDEFKQQLQTTVLRSGPPFPVGKGSAFEQILTFCVRICRAGFDAGYKQLAYFFQENLFSAFNKLLTDDNISSWNQEIQVHIFRRCEQVIRLVAMKMGEDITGLLDLLALLLNPTSRFVICNSSKPSETFPSIILPLNTRPHFGTYPSSSSADLRKNEENVKDEEGIPGDVYARCFSNRDCKGYLVDWLNVFGREKGFENLKNRIVNPPADKPLTISLLVSMLKPFGASAEFLTKRTVETYFLEVFQRVPEFLQSMSDEDFKKESGKQDGKTDPVTNVLRSLKQLVKVLPDHSTAVNQVIETTRLSAIMKFLKVANFNGKMHALNEINKIIQNLIYVHRSFGSDDDKAVLDAEKVASWLQQNGVLTLILADNMHQPQFVEKLEKIIRFMIKEKSLTIKDLDDLWIAQESGKHEVIVKNVHDLLTKLAWDFTPEQLDHLFCRFQESWVSASRRQREKLLELIRRLAEDDRGGVMGDKVLEVLWNLCHNDELPAEIMEQALAAHLKILDYTFTHEKETLKMEWLKKCVEEIKGNLWVVPALRHIKNICDQFPEGTGTSTVGMNRSIMTRVDVVKRLETDLSVIHTVIASLEQYLYQVDGAMRNGLVGDFDPTMDDLLGSKYPHSLQVEERLNFLYYIIKYSHEALADPQKLWSCLVENPVVEDDRDLCFKWFTQLMQSETDPDIRHEKIKPFFETHILQLEPSFLTESGIQCFSRFLSWVNANEGKIEVKRNHQFLLQLNDLVGGDYLWDIILTCKPEISQMGISLFRDLYGFPSQALLNNIIDLHQDVIEAQCLMRLRPICDTLSEIKNDEEEYRAKIDQDTNKAIRILRVITEYVQQYDKDYRTERVRPSLSRSTFGQGFAVQLKNPNGAANNVNDIVDIIVHTNETIGGFRRTLLIKYNIVSSAKVDLTYGNELIVPSQDRRLVTEVINDPNRTEKQVFSIKLAASYSGGTLLSDGAIVSSPDTSNDVSPADTPQDVSEDISFEMEKSLPSVWLSQNTDQMQFIIRLAELGSRLGSERLVNAARELLDILPPDEQVAQMLRDAAEGKVDLQKCFQMDSPSKMLYNLQVLLSILLPSRRSQVEEAGIRLYQFMVMRNLPDFLFRMLLQRSILKDSDKYTKERVYSCIMRLLKLMFYVYVLIGYTINGLVRSASTTPGYHMEVSRRGYPDEVLNMLAAMNSGIEQLTMVNYLLVEVASLVRQHWKEGIVTLPTLVVLKALRRIVWVGASGSLHLLQSSQDVDHETMEKGSEKLTPADVAFVEDAIDCLHLCFPLTESADDLARTSDWLNFFTDLLVTCRQPEIRKKARMRFGVLLHNCVRNTSHVANIVQYFFKMIHDENQEQPEMFEELFHFLSSLLQPFNYATRPLVGGNEMLHKELQWLVKCKLDCLDQNVPSVHDTVLEGHLLLIRALVVTLSPQAKASLRTSNDGPPLIKELLEQFLFPASRLLLDVTTRENHPRSRSGSGDAAHGSPSTTRSGDLFDDPDALLDMPAQARPICQSTASITAAFEVIVALCMGSTENLGLLYNTLTALFYSGDDLNIVEWDYSPAVGPRKTDGFVGLKNAGATCYMNSVLQQLYMTPMVRNGILQMKDVLPHYVDEEEEKGEGDAKRMIGPIINTDVATSEEELVQGPDYNSTLTKQLQIIFSHLACSKLQFYTPRGFWKNFKLGSEPINLREQHDALEFYISVLDTVDEGLKSKKKGMLMTEILGGTFADQKICRDCPHRYSREEPFTSISLDIRNYHTMQDALEHYVKGDLLEGANAYFCEKCQKKVDTVKRLCIKRLPPMLTIQLKRFDYDWEREQSIKFNDYFEFPRQIDMEPYTAPGLAKVEGHIIPDDDEILMAEVASSTSSATRKAKPVATQYRLVGIVVHSGQAAGGHYYSYILDRDGDPKWYRFDDGDVTECKMDDDEEMKTQCFGGEQPQKRWWSAYLLFYERMDVSTNGISRDKGNHGRIRMMSESIGSQVVYMIPQSLRRSILKQNLKFAHTRSQFIPEYFTFLKRLLSLSVSHLSSMWNGTANSVSGADNPEMSLGALAIMRLIGKFVFEVGFRTKRTLRGPAAEWSENFCKLLQYYVVARKYFVMDLVLCNPKRLMEFLLECPQQDVRGAFLRMLQTTAFFGREDVVTVGQVQKLNKQAELSLPEESMSMEKLILRAVMDLAKRKEFSDNSRNLGNFLYFFTSSLQNFDITHKYVCIELGLPELLIKLVGDDAGPSMVSKYNQHSDQVNRLLQIVGHLVLLMNFSDLYTTPQERQRPRSPIAIASQTEDGQTYVKASTELCNSFSLSSTVLKRIFDDCNVYESPFRQMLKWIAWENPHISARINGLLLTSLSTMYQPDYHRIFEFVLDYIQMEDSWTLQRVNHFFFGPTGNHADGYLATLNRFRSAAPRKAYLGLKFLVALMTQESTAGNCLREWLETDWPPSQVFRAHFAQALDWLNKELNPIRNNPTNFFGGYNNSFNWNNHQITSNEQSTTNTLERTDSARELLNLGRQYLGLNDPYVQEGNGADDEEEAEDDYGNYASGGLEMGSIGVIRTSSTYGMEEPTSNIDADTADSQFYESIDDVDAAGAYGPAPRKSHTHERRNGAAPDQIREKLVSGGIMNSQSTSERANSIEALSGIMDRMQLHNNQNASAGDSFRPGTPVEEIAQVDIHGLLR